MAKALSAFYDYVTPHVLGCPIPLLNQALLVSAAEFCRRTAAVQETAVQSVSAGVSDYDIDVPADTRLAMVLGVWIGEAELHPAGTDEVHAGTAVRGSGGGATAAVGSPSVYFQKQPYDPVISLYPVPQDAVADGLAVRAAFEPSTTATTLPDALFDYHQYDIAAGAIAYLASLPAQPFTNPGLAADFRMRFEDAVNRTRPLSRAGRVRRAMHIQPRRFA